MTIDEITEYVESLGGVLTQRPGPGDSIPEIAWGDSFFYYAPDGTIPHEQPFATLVTKDYPGEPSSGLGIDGTFWVSVNAGSRGSTPTDDPGLRDVVMPHPVYAGEGWVCVVAPGSAAEDELRGLLRDAHAAAARRHERRGGG